MAGEGDDRVEPVAELGEHAVDRLVVALALGAVEADRGLGEFARAGVGGHDEDDVLEIDALAVVVGELAVIHHLQQDVEQVGMRLLDLVEQEHAMRVLVDAVGEQPALIEADIAGRRADQPRNGVALHIFAHVEAEQLDAEEQRELARDLGLADAGRAREHVAADRLSGSRRPARDSLIAAARASIAWFCPNTTRFKSWSIARSTSASDFDTVLAGMRAMVAMVDSTSLTPMILRRCRSGTSICEAPVSSITSIALSGSLRSWMYFADSSTADLIAWLV